MMKAATWVNNPSSSKRLPMISIAAASMSSGGRLAGPATGKPTALTRPCCRNSKATTIRTTLSTRGCHSARNASLTITTDAPMLRLQRATSCTARRCRSRSNLGDPVQATRAPSDSRDSTASELDVELLELVGLGLRRADPVAHRRPGHDVPAISRAIGVELDVIGEKTRADRGIHGIRHGELAEEVRPAIGRETVAPDGDDAVD